MAGATHPFFGNQYTNGGYITGSFKFPEGLKSEVGKGLAKITVPDTVPAGRATIPPACNSTHLKSIVKTGRKSKWIVPALIIAAAGGYFVYKHFQKKGKFKILNVGICEFCGEPLSGAKFIPNGNTSHIICKKCDKKNFAKYLDDESSDNLNGGEEDREQNVQRRNKESN